MVPNTARNRGWPAGPAVRFRHPPLVGGPPERHEVSWSSRVGRGNAADVPRDATGSQLACLASESGSIPLRGARRGCLWLRDGPTERPSCVGSQVLIRYTSAPMAPGVRLSPVPLPRPWSNGRTRRCQCCGEGSTPSGRSLAFRARVWPIGEASAFQADQEGFDSPGPLHLGVGQRLSRLPREQDHVGSIPTAQTDAVVIRKWETSPAQNRWGVSPVRVRVPPTALSAG